MLGLMLAFALCLVPMLSEFSLTAQAAGEAGVPFVEHFATREEITAWLCANAHPGDYVLFKGSHGMALGNHPARFL